MTQRRYTVGRWAVGHMSEGVYTTRRNPETGMLRSPRGWAFEDDLLARLQADGCKWVQVQAKGSGETWQAPLAVVMGQGVGGNWGAGPQTCLPLDRWAYAGASEASPADVAAFLRGLVQEASGAGPGPCQGSLPGFGG